MRWRNFDLLADTIRYGEPWAFEDDEDDEGLRELAVAPPVPAEAS